jgi:hypothetical protein
MTGELDCIIYNKLIYRLIKFLTGPMLLNGDELAQIASRVLGVEMKFDDVLE